MAITTTQAGDWQATEARAISVPRSGRDLMRNDPVEYAIVTGQPIPAGEPIKADAEGWFSGRSLAPGYVEVFVRNAADRVAFLEATGHSMVYVDGEPRAGDVYGYGYLSLPVKIRGGGSRLLFRVDRGRLRLRLVNPTKPVSFHLGDPTLPDRREGERGTLWAALVVRNATEEPLKNLEIETISEGGGRRKVKTGDVMALSIRKLAFQIDATGTGKTRVILRQKGKVLDETTVEPRLRKPGETYRRTFISRIDGSVQYYAVSPSAKPGPGQALVLSLHGASVEAQGQADAYGPRDWGHIVAPTNRRPFGFDWEEVGRRDGLEVLELARRELKTDPKQTYLTGHSMGGHGTWQLGVLYSDRFAAIGPSAGWISFSSYAGGMSEPTDPVRRMLWRATASSDTLAMVRNYSPLAIYGIHGDADDNVPVSEMRRMRQELSGWHTDNAWHEQPGAGHWWDENPAPGADCVDWRPMWDLFRKHTVDVPTSINFTTPNPAISADHFWARVEQLEPTVRHGNVKLAWGVYKRQFEGTTRGVRRLRLTPPSPGPVTISLDGQTLKARPNRGHVHLINEGGWKVAGGTPAGEKNPEQAGPVKEVLDRGVVFVYGTVGSPGETEWARAKARFDAETFYYRGNGAVDVVADREFRASAYPDRNVVLYGSANLATGAVLGTTDVQVVNNNLRVGDRGMTGLDLAVAYIRPRRNSRVASVAVLAATGPTGRNLLDRFPLFSSGVGIPDLVVLTSVSIKGDVRGFLGAGFFGPDWSIARGDFAWRN